LAASRSSYHPKTAPAAALTTSARTPAKKSIGATLLSVMKSVNHGVETFNRTMDRTYALQQATTALKADLLAERNSIETGLRLAAHAIELEERLKDPRFKKNYEHLMQAIALDEGQSHVPQDLVNNPVPTFTRTQRHHDAEIEEIIQRTLNGLKDEREAFLSAAHGRLSADPVLRRHFLKVMLEIGRDRYVAAMDPSSSWSR
jgi:DNA helicase-4